MSETHPPSGPEFALPPDAMLVCARQVVQSGTDLYFRTIGDGIERRYLADTPGFSYESGLGAPFDYGFRLSGVAERVREDDALPQHVVTAMLEGRKSDEQLAGEHLMAEWGHIVVGSLVDSYSAHVDDHDGREPEGAASARGWRIQSNRDGSNPVLVVSSGISGEPTQSVRLDALYEADPTFLSGHLRAYHSASAVVATAEHVQYVAETHNQQALDNLPDVLQSLLTCPPEEQAIATTAMEQFTARITQWETGLAPEMVRVANRLGTSQGNSDWFPSINALGHRSVCAALPEPERQPKLAVYQTLLNFVATANNFSMSSGARSPMQRFMANPHEFMPDYLTEAGHNIDHALEWSSYEPDRFEAIDAKVRHEKDKDAATDCITHLGITSDFLDAILTLDKGMETDSELFGVIFHALLLDKQGHRGVRTASFRKFAELILSRDEELLPERREVLERYLS